MGFRRSPSALQDLQAEHTSQGVHKVGWGGVGWGGVGWGGVGWGGVGWGGGKSLNGVVGLVNIMLY